jgi:hypothetical protein
MIVSVYIPQLTKILRVLYGRQTPNHWGTLQIEGGMVVK